MRRARTAEPTFNEETIAGIRNICRHGELNLSRRDGRLRLYATRGNAQIPRYEESG